MPLNNDNDNDKDKDDVDYVDNMDTIEDDALELKGNVSKYVYMKDDEMYSVYNSSSFFCGNIVR